MEVGRRNNDKPKLSEERFSISYDAPEDILENHEIDAKELGDAILGMSTLIEETAKLVGRGSAEVKLKVTTPAKEGSLVVAFALMATPATAAKVLAILGLATHASVFAGSTVIELIKKIKNRKIISVIIDGDDEHATIKTTDGEFKADKTVARLVSDGKVREALHKIVQAPLTGKEGAVFKVLDSEEKPVISVNTEDVDDFSRLPVGSLEEITSETITATVTFSQINFGSKKGWRIVLPDGDEHPATLADEAFLEKVTKNQQSFQKEDRYQVKLKTTVTHRPTRSTIDRIIVEVVRNWDAPNRNR
ncbi:hypothetical protein KDX38_28535 [Pseudomonas sp. CDFA 602]|uniref:hypothetical protein n=1 Tax=Pseudomonas californiensis TaxID=2829823 RepID=UPI001E2CA2EF|nr:hypothetical protein [Pseudomonas californiensis]MCD5997493.1 hypothetical protein [Pseudomonas californiensis]MCD6003101.1 hypothetical protein [Pseudomonas californiensis]